MALGIEAAGLALAMFPVVIDLVDWYGRRVTGRDLKHLAESLRNNEQIFLNSLRCMLQSIVPPAMLHDLVNDLEGTAWKDAALNDRVIEYLGPDAKGILEKITDIYKTVRKLKHKLPARDDAKVDQNLMSRAKAVVKSFVHGQHAKISLERLRIRIAEFRMLTEDAIKLAPSRSGPPKALRDLDLVHECASGLHDALQAGWKCDCERPHPANIQLDIWSMTGAQGDSGSGSVRFKFSFLFAHDAKDAQPDHWVTAEITLSRTGSQRPGIVVGSVEGGSNPLAATSISTAMGAISLTGSQPGSRDAQGCQGTASDAIDDLCPIFTGVNNTPRPVRRRVGSISDSSGHNYHLFSEPDPVTATPAISSFKLAERFGHASPLSNSDRVQLALMLAWGVLQMSSTDWLKGKWTKDNVLLVMDGANRPSPYISHAFQSSRRTSQSSTDSTLNPTITNQIEIWIKNVSLFALGVFLLEVCYHRSIEDLASKDEKAVGGELSAYTPILTAMRLSKTVQKDLGLHYAKAVNACLQFPDVEMDAEGRPKDSSKFAKSVLREVVEPLKAAADFFEHGS